MTLYLKGHRTCDIFYLKHLNLLNKKKIFQLWPAVFLTPLEVEQHTVSPMKALIGGELEYRGLMHDSLFTLCHPLCKIALLVHRMGLGQFVALSTVYAGYDNAHFLGLENSISNSEFVYSGVFILSTAQPTI